ncbi:MAG: Type restriction-modification system, DNA-methyltransferase subunit [Labilithrix sp.]|nr:Type restriction-modification system, DNA-methyltransferase subunit [Labilithrix sp.]
MPKRHRAGVSATSTLAHIEELVVATSGEDAFEVVFAVAACLLTAPRSSRRGAVTPAAIAAVTRARPELGVVASSGGDASLVARVDALLAPLLAGDQGPSALDAIFEALVPRLAKGDKGQFFTPRHVVEFMTRVLAPRASEVVIDPACGSGAFLAHARRLAKVETFGCDVDPRAIRVARLVALGQAREPSTMTRADGLHARFPRPADVVATNPPFAGRAAAEGFAVAELVRTPERDVLFLERALDLLRPGGRLGIILPYNKASGAAFASLRRWLVARARLYAVVGLPRETFLPHTSQRTFVLFAKKRAGEAPDEREQVRFVVSERAGKDTAGDPVLVRGVPDHDLEEVLGALTPFLTRHGFFA